VSTIDRVAGPSTLSSSTGGSDDDGVIDTIVVPVDGTATSRAAIAAAILLARAWTSPIQLVTVISPGIDPLEATLALDRELDGIDAPTRRPVVLADNDVARALTTYADRRSLICIGAHGRSAVGTLFLGSVTREVLARAVTPVVVVGPDCAPSPVLDTICVPVRPGSAFSGRAVSEAVEWARAFGARLHLIGAPPLVDEVLAEDPTAADALRVLADGARASGVEACWQLVPGDDIAARVLDAATDLSASLIVLATRARRPIARLVLGSVAQDIMRRSPCPVLVVPPASPGHESPRAA
jgi:nucleotide-binding universal stress UspA family protein